MLGLFFLDADSRFARCLFTFFLLRTISQLLAFSSSSSLFVVLALWSLLRSLAFCLSFIRLSISLSDRDRARPCHPSPATPSLFRPLWLRCSSTPSDKHYYTHTHAHAHRHNVRQRRPFLTPLNGSERERERRLLKRSLPHHHTAAIAAAASAATAAADSRTAATLDPAAHDCASATVDVAVVCSSRSGRRR